MKKSIIFSAAALIALFGTQALVFSQGCHGGSSSSGGHNHGETADKAKSSKTSSTDKVVTYYTCPMHPEVVNKKPGKCPKCGMELVQKASGIEQPKDSVYYTCSMHPEVKEAKPGNCPKCGMALIKKEQTTASEKTTAVFQCPMKCEGKKTYDKAGKCPECGMALAEVKTKKKEKKEEEKK